MGVKKGVLTNIFGNMNLRILSRLSRPLMANIRRNMGNQPAPVGKLEKPSGFNGPLGAQMARHLGVTLVVATYLTWHWYYFYSCQDSKLMMNFSLILMPEKCLNV